MSVHRDWVLAGGQILRPAAPFGIMGIVNASHNSFYREEDCALSAAEITAHALRLRLDGADILDLGGESSHPGVQPVDEKEERARLLPVLTQLKARASGTFLSVDTYHASTAASVLAMGVHIINDISGALWDPEMADVLASFRPGYVLMHTQGRPRTMQNAPVYKNVVDEVISFFEQNLARLVRNGLPEDRIVLDPGIGFGKSMEHNLALLRNIPRLLTLNRPLLVGISMKQVFGDLLGLGLNARKEASQVATVLLWEAGVFWHRVHHVAATRRSLTLAHSLRPNNESYSRFGKH